QAHRVLVRDRRHSTVGVDEHVLRERVEAREEALAIGVVWFPMRGGARAVREAAGKGLLRRGGHGDRAESQREKDTLSQTHAGDHRSIFFSSATVVGCASSIGGSKPSESAPAGAADPRAPAVDPNIAATTGVTPRVFFAPTAAPRSTSICTTVS